MIYNLKQPAMKKILLFVATVALGQGLLAQCNPADYDFGTAAYGIYPDTTTGINTGIVNTAYSQTFYMKVPVQASDIPAEFIPSTIPTALVALATIDYLTIDNVQYFDGSGMQDMTVLMGAGYNMACSPADCQFLGGTQNCVTINGTPNAAGNYPLTITASGNVTVNLFGVLTPYPVPAFPIEGYVLHVSQDAGISITGPGSFEVYNAVPNPSNRVTNVHFEMPMAAEVKVVVTNMLGEKQLEKTMMAKKGQNECVLETENWDAGVYLYSIDTPKGKVTKRLVVQH